jgi:hypothetical protein
MVSVTGLTAPASSRWNAAIQASQFCPNSGFSSAAPTKSLKAEIVIEPVAELFWLED